MHLTCRFILSLFLLTTVTQPLSAQTPEVLYAFEHAGVGPEAPLVVGPDGSLYGTTVAGASFHITP